MANVSITALTAYTDAASTDVLPIVDVGANVTKKISISDILKATPAGTAALPAIAIDGDPNTGIYSPGADQLALTTGGSQRLLIDSGGAITTSSTITAGGTIQALQTFQSSSGTDVVLNANGANRDAIFKVNGSELMRLQGSGRLLVGTSSDSGGALLQVNGDRIRVGTAKTPASATATGAAGEICWDASYIYVCTATNTWKRAAIATW